MSANCLLMHLCFIFCFVLTQVIAIAMDVFTDIDIFKDLVDASIRGIPVYILLDDFHFKSFLAMATNLDIQIQKLRVSDIPFFFSPHYTHCSCRYLIFKLISLM